ncbi:MAG: sugar transferase [Caldilineales bacterium]
MRKPDPPTVLFFVFADLLVTLIAYFIAEQGRYWLPFGVPLAWNQVAQPWTIYAVVGFIWGVTLLTLRIYELHPVTGWRGEVQAIAWAVGLASLLFAGVLYFSYRELPRRLFLYFLLADLLLLTLFHLGARAALLWSGWPQVTARRVLLVGSGDLAQSVALALRKQSRQGLVLVGSVDDGITALPPGDPTGPWLGNLENVPRVVTQQQVDEIVCALSLRTNQTIQRLVLTLQGLPVRVRVAPDYLDLIMRHAPFSSLDGLPLVGLREPALSSYQRRIKRLFDLVLGTAMLLLLWPLMLLVAVAIKLDSKGPALFRQQRIGENGRPFEIFKFRSMVVDAERIAQTEFGTNGEIIHKQPNDPRVTSMGRLLRRTSMDELPQLFNVLRGEMSLVGPRPELPWLVANYEDWQHGRFAAPPGMTGWWQINGRSDRLMHMHTEDDLYYIQNYSPALDLQILWRTIGVVWHGRGAY